MQKHDADCTATQQASNSLSCAHNDGDNAGDDASEGGDGHGRHHGDAGGAAS